MIPTRIEETTPQVLITLIHNALNSKPRILPSLDIDWVAVYSLASKQGVVAIAWDGLLRLQEWGYININSVICRELRLRWALSVERVEKRYIKQRNALARLSTMLDEAGICVAPLKGYGLSLCYPIAEHRSCSDIDIWLFGEQQRADELLRTKHNISIDEDEHHHTVFYIDGVMVENHYDFLNIHAHHSSRAIERHLKTLNIESCETVAIDNATVYLPSADCHALFLLRHAASHFAAVEIVLRHVIDWGLFIKHYHGNIDWPALRAICRKQGMEQFLDTMNALAAEVCGIDINLMPDTKRDPYLERRILSDILKPEFSHKKPDKGVIRIVLFKLRRWWANRWKHRLVYSDGLLHSFITQTISHIKKPKGIKA